MDSVVIRAVTDRDFDQWLPLWKGYQRFYEIDIPDQVTRQIWDRFLDADKPLHAALAVSAGRARGLVHSVYHPSTWTMHDYCYLQDLFVAEDGRGGGLGRKLVEHVYADATARGAARVYWLTHESNVPAQQLYDRIADRTGFIQYRKQLS
jgi:ribosomal protein S18 acetylase RimI-like enzyme